VDGSVGISLEYWKGARQVLEFEVTVNYCLWHTRVHRVKIDNNNPEELAEFHEAPNDFCGDENLTDEYEGDVMNGTWEEVVKEINPLVQIVEALNDDSE